MTTGENITETYAEENAGGTQVQDADIRYRYLLAFQWAANTAETYRPANRRLQTTTVTITAGGVADMPSTYAGLDPNTRVTLVGSRIPPIAYLTPGEFFELLRQNPSASGNVPRFWTIAGQDVSGNPQLYVYPPNASSIQLRVDNHVRKAPTLVDRPPAPTVNETGAGDVTGDVQYAVTFVTTDGETEPGPRTTFTADDNEVSLSDIAVSASRIVTGRKVYRTIAGGTDLLLLTHITDNVTTTFTDDVLDAALGAAAPTVFTAVTGMERFPENFHNTTLRDLARLRLARNKGDGRSGGELPQAVATSLAAMWADENTPARPGRVARYGAGRILRGDWR